MKNLSASDLNRFHQSAKEEKINNWNYEKKQSKCIIDVDVLHSLNQHLKQQENRCRQLEAALDLKIAKSESTLRGMKCQNKFRESGKI